MLNKTLWLRVVAAVVTAITGVFLLFKHLPTNLLPTAIKPPEILTTSGLGWSITTKTGTQGSNYPIRTSGWWKSAVIKPCEAMVYPYPYILKTTNKGISLGV